MCYPMGEESMSSGLRIEAASGIYNVGPIPKAGCTTGISGIVPAGNLDGIAPSGNTDTFPRA